MTSAFANHGLGQEAISLFEDMKSANIKPNGVTMVVLLMKAGNIRNIWNLNIEFILPRDTTHVSLIVLGSGCLEEAFNLICNLPVAPNSAVSGALLAACRVHCNFQMAEVAASKLFKMNQTILVIIFYCPISMLMQEGGMMYQKWEQWLESSELERIKGQAGLSWDMKSMNLSWEKDHILTQKTYTVKPLYIHTVGTKQILLLRGDYNLIEMWLQKLLF